MNGLRTDGGVPQAAKGTGGLALRSGRGLDIGRVLGGGLVGATLGEAGGIVAEGRSSAVGGAEAQTGGERGGHFFFLFIASFSEFLSVPSSSNWGD